MNIVNQLGRDPDILTFNPLSSFRLSVTAHSAMSTAMRTALRRLTPLARSLHTTSRSLAPAAAAAARRVPIPVKSAAAASSDPFSDIDFDPSPRTTSSPQPSAKYTPRPTYSPAGAADVKVSPPLTDLPDAQYEPLPDAGSVIPGEARQDWGESFVGLAQEPFAKEVAEALLKPLSPDMIEVKPGQLVSLQSGAVLRLLPLHHLVS